MTRYVVVGDPIAHSKSPQIHALFARQTGEAVEYEKQLVRADEFETFVAEFFAAGGGGLNITLPHKEPAFRLAASVSQQARLARAVNTLWLNAEGQLQAENTDGKGIVRDISVNHGVEFRNQRVLVLGAGGAARGALAAVIESGPASVTVLNRTLSRAEKLQDDFKDHYSLAIGDYQQQPEAGFDIIINATSMSIGGEMPALDSVLINPGCCCYDMMYGKDKTPFMQWAESNGAGLVLDGLGMLVEQAAESFTIWRGVRPETAPVIAALRE